MLNRIKEAAARLVMSGKTAGTPVRVRGPEHLQLIQREQTLGDLGGWEAVKADRDMRFLAKLHEIEKAGGVPPGLLVWAERMKERYGPTVRVWLMEHGWLTALLVVRYGEAEDNWPAAFTQADVVRALQWEQDPTKKPQGVTYKSEEA